MYHSINGPKHIPTYLNVSKENFENQILYLKNNYNIISYNQFMDGFRDWSYKPNSVLITFDDGHKDNYTQAYPILRKHHIPAIMFILTNRNHKKHISDTNIKTMQGLIKFGDHSKTHRDLTKLNTEEIRIELEHNSNIFAYPYGRYNAKVLDLVKKFYIFGFTTKEGLVKNNSSPLELERISITNQNIPEFAVTIEGFNKYFNRAYQLLK
jgi:peptidoglycan/xylan/chitin deacetylase (PgdA/CDA1 family)